MGSQWITLLLPAVLALSSHAYDGYSACPKQYRSVRLRAQLPCDFQQQSWCTVPGSAYPWHAVRRFVHENHGLMRRMYGDERHISVLRAEIESNDVELIRDPSWHLEDDVKRRYSAKPHFRPANRNQPPPPPPPPVPTEPPTSTAPPTSRTATSSSPTTPSSTPGSTTTSTMTSSSTTGDSSTASSSTVPPATTTSTPEPEVLEPVGLYNGRIHPHLINASHLTSTPAPPSTSPSTPMVSEPTTPASSSSSSPATATTLDDWATDETTEEPTIVTTLPTPSSSPSPSSTTSTTSTASTSTDEEELSDVEDNVADDSDAESSSAQETLFQDADHQPGPDAAQQPGKPATPLIKLRGVNACPVKEEVVAPFWANNTRGEVLALLNLYPFEQYVHWEKCTHEHKQMFCREGCRCEQQYRLHRLLAYDPNNECRGIFSDWFKFPSCCICRCYDLPAEFRFTSRSPRTPVLRDPARGAAARHTPGPPKDWYRLQASGG